MRCAVDADVGDGCPTRACVGLGVRTATRSQADSERRPFAMITNLSSFTRRIPWAAAPRTRCRCPELTRLRPRAVKVGGG